jgi:hypothetical protein
MGSGGLDAHRATGLEVHGSERTVDRNTGRVPVTQAWADVQLDAVLPPLVAVIWSSS